MVPPIAGRSPAFGNPARSWRIWDCGFRTADCLPTDPRFVSTSELLWKSAIRNSNSEILFDPRRLCGPRSREVCLYRFR